MKKTTKRAPARTRKTARVMAPRQQFTTTALCFVTIAALLIFNSHIVLPVARAQEADVPETAQLEPEAITEDAPALPAERTGNDNSDNGNNGGGNEDNIDICHYEGNGSAHIITTDDNGWNGHQNHEHDFIIETEQDRANCVDLDDNGGGGDGDGEQHVPTITLAFDPTGVLDEAETLKERKKVYEFHAGDEITLSWNSEYTDSCFVPHWFDWGDDDIGGKTSGTFSFVIDSNLTFALTCEGEFGATTTMIRAIVRDNANDGGDNEVPPPTLVFTTNYPEWLDDGQTESNGNDTYVVPAIGTNIAVFWTTTNAASCVIPTPTPYFDWPNFFTVGQEMGTTSMYVVENIDSTKTFALTCTGPGGNVTELITLAVNTTPDTSGEENVNPVAEADANDDQDTGDDSQTPDDQTPDVSAPTAQRSSNKSSAHRSVLGASDTNGSVLGASASCGLYILSEDLQYGKDNDPEEVKKLQAFLNEYTGSNLPMNGIFGLATLDAVKRFQVQFKSDILTPWAKVGWIKNDNEGTGWVYKTTRRMINNIICPELQIPLPKLP